MKNSIKRVCAALAVSAVAVSATSVFASAVEANYDGSAFPFDQYGITAEQVENSEVKPSISISQEEISLADAKANPRRTVTLTVSGAERKYNAFGLHVAYDGRLTVNKLDEEGNIDANYGTIFSKGKAVNSFMTKETDITTGSVDEEGNVTDGLIFFTGAGDGNVGRDGVMTQIDFSLPENVAEGDIYYVGFEYHNTPSTEDQFVASPNNEASKIMQGWVFTQGLSNGYIKIKEAESTTTTTTESTTTTTTTSGSATSAASTTAPGGGSPQTGVNGVGVAAAGLAVAIGTAFVLRKKED